MHKNYTILEEIHQGVLPQDSANTVSDYYKDGKSVAEVLGKLRIDGKKVNPSVIKEAYSHINTIEETVVRLLNGTSIIYLINNPPEIPNNLDDLKLIIADVVEIDKDKYSNVYDVSDLSELLSQINHVIDNIISINGNFAALKTAVQI